MKHHDVREIARLAGVSPATVSRYYNGFKHISKIMRDKIEQAVREKERLSDNVPELCLGIGYIAKRGVLEFYSDIMDDLTFQCQENGIATKVIGLRLESDQKDLIKTGYSSLSALVLVGGITPPEVIAQICRTGLPMILIDNSHPLAHSVCIDNRRGVENAVDMLYKMGHRKIALIGANEGHYSQWSRYQGYRQAMARHRLEELVEYYDGGDFFEEGGKMAERLIKRSSSFTAIISTGEMMTLGAVGVLKSRGLAVPEKVSVIGFGEPEVAESYRPRISTISLMSSQVVTFTVHLFKMLALHTVHEPISVYLTPKIEMRDSCRTINTD